jgi:hypothetical protein
MTVHRRLRALDDSVESGYPDRADLAQLLRGAGLAVEDHAGEVAIRRDLIGTMIGTLARLAGHPASARLEQGRDPAGNAALIISVTGSGTASSPFTGDLAADRPDAELLGSYLIAWHHGGTLKAAVAEGQSRFVLTLPKTPDAVVLPKPDEDWLVGQFSMLEGWQQF